MVDNQKIGCIFAINFIKMYNKERIELIVKEWFEFKTGVVLSDDTLSKLVDDITDTKQCDIK